MSAQIPLVLLMLCAGQSLRAQTTVDDASREAFTRPIPTLTGERRTPFFVGNSFFNQNWVAAPASVAGRDGLGPLFNTRSCSTCHFEDGRSAAPVEDRPFSTTILRISIPGAGPNGAPIPDPVYGGQIQGSALPGVAPEADVRVTYEIREGKFPDGESYSLASPKYRLENPGYGPISTELLMSARVAPAVIGLGLLECVPESVLLEKADPDDRDKDGISGRVNRVWDSTTQSMAVGRFGWKAEQATVKGQVAAAFQGDMSLTTTLLAEENHTSIQDPHLASGGNPEVSDKILNSVAFYCQTLAVPASREGSARGAELFGQLGCAACHTPELTTGTSPGIPELSRQVIRPYTDLLLHDLGGELSDGRPVFLADGGEWRTPPLWGIGLIPKVNGHTSLLHDGRARNLTEAILWHGGEALAAREKFHALPKVDREALIKFIESL
jgi:CxxC motif-containing protein (DUF1111 family)